MLPPEVILNLKKYLLFSKTDVLSASAIGQCIVRHPRVQEQLIVANQIQILLEDTSIRELLESLLMLACDKGHPCRESLTKIDSALRLILVFTERILTSSKLLKAVLQSFSSNMVSDMLRQYASQMQVPMHLGFTHGHNAIDVCPLSYRESQVRFHQSLAVMVLESALRASQCGGHFDVSIMTLLLEKLCLHCPAQPASVGCTQRGPIKLITPKLSLFEAVSTPRVDSVSLSWRDGLMRELSRDVDCRYEGVVRMVGEICRDLELRCNEIECPLREEQLKSRGLQERLESSERNVAEMEFQARNHQSTFSALETERDCLVNQVEAAERQLKELGTSLDDIHQEFDRAKIEAERAAQAAIESARQQDLAYLATMTGKDEIFEEQSLKLASTEDHVRTLQYELTHVRRLEANNAEKLENSEKHIETSNHTVSALERHVQDLQNELIQLNRQDTRNIAEISNSEALIQELNSTIVAVNEAFDQNELLVSKMKDQLQKMEVETSELRSQHEMYVSAKEAEMRHLDASNRSSNEKWQSELELAHRRAAAASEQSAATMASLHCKVRKLRKEREVRMVVDNTALPQLELGAARYK